MNDLDKKVQALIAKFKYIDTLCKAGHDYNDLPIDDIPTLRDMYAEEIGPIKTTITGGTTNGGTTTTVIYKAA